MPDITMPTITTSNITTPEGTFYRDTWAEVDLSAIAHNVRAVQRHIGLQRQVMAVVKANAYGHGAVQVAAAALAAGAAQLGVATLDEALALRAAGVRGPILVLGYVPPRHAAAAAHHAVMLTVVSARHADQLASCMDASAETPLDVHLKIDTGMGRLGVRTAEELLQAAAGLSRNPNIHLRGAFTHLAQSDAETLDFTKQQLQTAAALFDLLRQHVPGEAPLLLHAANSGGILQVPASHFNMVRLGISLYGVYPSEHLRSRSLALVQALQLKSRIAHLKEVPPGTPIGYGSTYVTRRATLVATVPIGYADGLPRALSNRGYFLVHGRPCPIIGRVCMDQTMIDVTDCADAQEADEVVIYNDRTLPELAGLIDTIAYELLCAIAPRVPRVYHH
ncbi:alanine racemase [Alicyclobacillus cycloheptanicus]|uniref:Alanine racemase n=1 Tax=Alicyclobacillus cycloheptanicus TaxID=1457 RepID=A0ABT9XJN9_9BACL|nr:alanine racemase [Alicyclobacillus cycloheptanicus]MDQ0190340.1 alanine racemase [Alicyclobacillus cycloheptanicus]WDM00020.1 alanine racemase [Alicyclobacillus cycloheptanicus]